jgi:endonuclease YncB( thermonuclease family)
MALFAVSSIIDGDTFEVSGGWKWNGETGTRVRPTGYDAPELHAYGGQVAKEKLERLILGKQVDLRTAHRVDRGRLVCDVFFQGRNLADYFSEYQ